MAFTGFAATLLPNGKTTHKTLGLPMPLFADSTSNIKIQSKEAECLKKTDVFIWDEAPMAPRYALEVMDHLLQDLMQNNLKFGDKIVILGGDFRQLLPVQQNVTRSEIVNLSIKFSSLWQHFKIFSLTENMRILRHEQEFANFLLDLGNGTLNDQFNNIEVLLRCVADLNANIVKDTYEEIFKHYQYRLTAKRAILSARNVDVEELNKQVVNLLDESTERVYTSIDTTETINDIHDINKTILTEYLSTLNPAILPPHKLRLKKYTIIMLIRNLNISEGLYNGTTLLILELRNNLLKCEILTGDKKGEIVFLNRITLYCENVYSFVMKRRQFPIKIAFAMTINKSQGQTFDKIAIDLRKDIFNHDQLYMAFSRVRSWKSLKIDLGQKRQNRLIKNYVYTEMFQ
ncbi:ATP-dependent DNA helicase pif1-like [Monomorium pharaonis]|uniref:ATP-dependent DNA helicase pif1-like n=1 Tax=Monomorium pharaonis TaxID=307658 RepID=UPI001746F25B|nr:ATP-dependent DNA helicase pif1-like [Monomorium pharaonis]